MTDINKIITENKKRWEGLSLPYDPLVGIGGPLKRVPLLLSENERIFVPESMMETSFGEAVRKAGTFERAIETFQKTEEIDRAIIQRKFVSLRCEHDCEFWMASCVIIADRLTGALIPFVVNREQRLILPILEQMRLAGLPIRLILLKARQIGGSTFMMLYIAWLQLFHAQGKNAFIIADEDSKAKNIFERYVTMAAYHPQDVVPGVSGTIVLPPYAKIDSIRSIAGRHQYVGMASSKNPDKSRSFVVHFFLCSEVAYWDNTPTRTPASIIQAVMGTFPENQSYTLYVEESTANGPGDHFAHSCQAAHDGKSKNKFAFVPFFENVSEYYEPISQLTAFVQDILDRMNNQDASATYEWFQWESGATLEHIAWWRTKSRGQDDIWRVKAEFPTVWTEPFEGTGIPVFRIEYVYRAQRQCREPIARGVLIADSRKGKSALKNIKFQVKDKADIAIWEYPGELVMGRQGKRYTNRYCFFGDVGGRTAEADYSGGKIFDRAMMMFGGVPKVVAELHTHMDQDLFAWYAAMLCMWYDKALYAVEINKVIDPDVAEPESGYTILDEIKQVYPNLYYRVKPETVKDHWDGLVGFHTNTLTKKMIMDHLNGALRDSEYEERSKETIEELITYEFKDTGRKKMGAKEGNKDDRVVYTAGGVWLCSQMDPVVEIDIASQKPYKSPEGHAAVFG